jgi:hypothetical protein
MTLAVTFASRSFVFGACMVAASCAASGGAIDDVSDAAPGLVDAGAALPPSFDASAVDASVRDGGAQAVDAGAPRDVATVSDGSGGPSPDAAPPRDAGAPTAAGLLIARYTESSAFKAIAIWNKGASTVDLSRYGLCLVSNANTYCNAKAMLSGSLAANAVRTVCYGAATSVPICDLNSNTVNVNGDDRIGLFLDANGDGVIELTDTPVDAFGELRVPPSGTPWADKTFARWNCVPRDGAGAFVVTSWFDDVQPNPDTTGLRLTPSCR